MLPGMIGASAPAVTRAAFRGGERGRQRVQSNLLAFEKAGITPTVGQATENRLMRGAESLLSRTPGGSGRIVAVADEQSEALARTIEGRAAQLARKTSGEQAGRAIEKGVDDFVSRFRDRQRELYDEVDAYMDARQTIPVDNTLKALTALTTPIAGAQKTSQALINPKLASIADGLASDAQGGAVPYRAIKELRTMIGREMDDSSLISDVPKSQWRRLYGALSEDMRIAANAAGPKVEAAWSRADNYTKAGMSRLEQIESVVQRSGGPEKIFQAAIANTKEGATTLRAVMQSLPPEGQRIVSATVLRRLGIASPSNQNELGERFNTQTFLSNWNRLSPEAKRTLFDRYGSSFRDDMDQIAKITGNLREGSKVFANPSGTQQATTQAATVGGLVVSLLTGQLGAAATIGALAGGANLSARLMTNPRFVHWLAQASEHPVLHAPSMLNQLVQQVAGDEDVALAAALLEQHVGDQGERDDG